MDHGGHGDTEKISGSGSPCLCVLRGSPFFFATKVRRIHLLGLSTRHGPHPLRVRDRHRFSLRKTARRNGVSPVQLPCLGLFPRCVIGCGNPGMTTRACLGMPPAYSNWSEKSINRWLSPISCKCFVTAGQVGCGVRGRGGEHGRARTQVGCGLRGCGGRKNGSPRRAQRDGEEGHGRKLPGTDPSPLEDSLGLRARARLPRLRQSLLFNACVSPFFSLEKAARQPDLRLQWGGLLCYTILAQGWAGAFCSWSFVTRSGCATGMIIFWPESRL